MACAMRDGDGRGLWVVIGADESGLFAMMDGDGRGLCAVIAVGGRGLCAVIDEDRRGLDSAFVKGQFPCLTRYWFNWALVLSRF